MITTLVVTNDFGPRAGGIETFIHGLLEQASKNQQRNFIVLTSHQSPQDEVIKFDQKMWENNRIRVVRDTARFTGKIAAQSWSKTYCRANPWP